MLILLKAIFFENIRLILCLISQVFSRCFAFDFAACFRFSLLTFAAFASVPAGTVGIPVIAVIQFPPLEPRFHFSVICNDDFWNDKLKEKAETFDVADLAKTLTKAGKKYFPLSQITWCDDADDAESAALLNGFFEAENFNANLSKKKAITIASSGKSPLY